MYGLGARRVELVDTLIAAAVGCGLPMEHPEATMIVVCGAGTTQVAVLSLGAIVLMLVAAWGGQRSTRVVSIASVFVLAGAGVALVGPASSGGEAFFGLYRADAFAAVSSGDNSNIIAARVARETFGIDQVVARIYDPGRAEVYQRLGISTVATVKWTADQVLRRLLPVGAEPDFRDPSGTIRVDQVPVPPKWIVNLSFTRNSVCPRPKPINRWLASSY